MGVPRAPQPIQETWLMPLPKMPTRPATILSVPADAPAARPQRSSATRTATKRASAPSVQAVKESDVTAASAVENPQAELEGLQAPPAATPAKTPRKTARKKA